MEPPGTLSGNTIVWDDIVENLPNGELGPQEEMILKVYLRAIHPSESLLTVNRAAIKEAVGRGGRKVSDVGEDEYNNDVGGNNAPVTKVLMTEPPIYAGMLVTFTIQVKNEGLVPIFSVPLRDAYNPGVLEFVRAVPPPSSSNQATGELQWSDVLALLGRSRLEPGETLDITTVYRAIQAVDESTNEVEVSGASDKYGNVLTPRHAQAPIRIVQAPSDTPTATATMVITATATATLQPTAAITATQPITAATATATLVATATPTPVLAQPTVIIITPWVPTPAPHSGGDDDGDGGDDDGGDDDNQDDNQMVTTMPTNTPIEQTATTTTATPDELAPLAHTTSTTDTRITATAIHTTTSATVTPDRPIPSELPNTSGDIPLGRGVGVWIGLLVLVVVLVVVVRGVGSARRQ
jgi:hypothetical protein